jgi:cytochrome c oxidase subunit 4
MTAFRQLILVWAVLQGLLLVTVTGSFLLSGFPSVALSFGVAFAKAGLIFWFFMHLREEAGLLRLAAVGAGAWLLILLILSGADYATRAMSG